MIVPGKTHFEFNYQILLPPLFNTLHFIYFIFLVQPLSSSKAVAHFKAQFELCFQNTVHKWKATNFDDNSEGKCIFLYSLFWPELSQIFLFLESMEDDNADSDDETLNESFQSSLHGLFFFTFMFVFQLLLLISDSFEEHIKFKTSRFDPNLQDVVKKFDGFVQEHLRIVDLASTDEETDLEEDRKGKPKSEYIFSFEISQNFDSHFLPKILYAVKHLRNLNQISQICFSSLFWLFFDLQSF